MSDGTPGPGTPGSGGAAPWGDRPQPGGVGPEQQGEPASRRSSRAPQEPGRRGLPRWALVSGIVLVVAVVVGVILILTNNAEPAPTPDPEVVTLPAPTPTVDPVDREPGTAFFEALPSTVLSYALAEVGEHEGLLADGALEAYRLVYSDGSASLTLHAGQWADAEAALAVFEQLVEAASADIDEAEAAEAAPAEDQTAQTDDVEDVPGGDPAPAPGVVEGTVEVDGAEVGRYLIVTRADGSATAWWTNGTVLIQVDGPAGAVRDVYAAYPL